MVTSADSSKGEAAAQEAKFGGFYSWRPSDDATFFPVRARPAQQPCAVVRISNLAICSMDVLPVVHHFATNPLCRGGRQSSLQKTNPSGTSASSTQR